MNCRLILAKAIVLLPRDREIPPFAEGQKAARKKNIHPKTSSRSTMPIGIVERLLFFRGGTAAEMRIAKKRTFRR